MLHFRKKNKIKKNTCRYHYQNLDDLHFLRYGAKHTEIGNFRSFFALLYQKSKFWNIKKFAGDIILHMCTKNNDHMMYGSWNKYK